MKYVRIGISLAVFVVVFISLYIPTNNYVVWIEDGVIKTSENEKIETLEEKIIRLVDFYATGTKAYEMKKTIYCESGYKNIQSNIVKNGVREDSWGVAQINLYYHPQVTKEQAMNEEFAVKWMSDNWGEVKWYGYIRATDSCNEIY
jgi:hypothetical protein